MGPKNLCARVCVGVCMHVFSIWNDYYDLVDLGGTTFNYEYSCVYLFLSEFSFLYYLCTFLYFEKYLLIYYNSRWWKYSSELNTHTHTHKNSINPTSLQPTNLPLLSAVKQNSLSSPYCFFTSISSSVYTNPTSVPSLLAKPTKTSRLLKARYISGCSLLILSKQAFTRLLSRADRAMACTKVPYRGMKWAEWKLLFKILTITWAQILIIQSN